MSENRRTLLEMVGRSRERGFSGQDSSGKGNQYIIKIEADCRCEASRLQRTLSSLLTCRNKYRRYRDS